MCGIAGIIGPAIAPANACDARMCEAIYYRGRDDQREWTDGRNAKLFHSRLSIIALDDGAQPMHDRSGRYTIVYNGEIYNYLELRDQYRKAGAQFQSASDTEVILEGFKLKGPSVCADLNGMFAFAIWDSQDRVLFLARDRLGKKPLFWTTINGLFYFASTLDAFSAIPGWTGRLVPSALDLFARLGAFPGELTVYEQARALPAASFAYVRADKPAVRTERYWKLNFGKRRAVGLNAACDEYEALLTEAIRIRLRADVPIALTFSGGVDSGTIAALAVKHLNTKLDCYTIDYHTADDESPETQIAQSAAAHLGLRWKHLQYDYRNDLFTDLIEAYRAFDQPSSQIPLSYSQRLYNSIRPHAKVVLSGGGADELFTGYVGDEKVLARDRIRMLARLLPEGIRKYLPWPLRNMLAAFLPRQEDLARYQHDYIAGGLTKEDAEGPAAEAAGAILHDILDAGVDSHLDLLTYMSLRFYGSEGNYRLPDITGLRAQVEVRSPFLDYRMVEFAASLPAALKIGNAKDAATTKFLPKHVYARHVSHEIAWASKKSMAMNVRFDKSLANDKRFEVAAENALGRVQDSGLPADNFRKAWTDYLRDKRGGISSPASAGFAMAGIMLGFWLNRQPVTNSSSGFDAT